MVEHRLTRLREFDPPYPLQKCRMLTQLAECHLDIGKWVQACTSHLFKTNYMYKVSIFLPCGSCYFITVMFNEILVRECLN